MILSVDQHQTHFHLTFASIAFNQFRPLPDALHSNAIRD